MDEDVFRQILAEMRYMNQFNRRMHRFYSIFLVVMVVVAITVPFLIRGGLSIAHKGDFSMAAERLLDDNKPNEVVALAENYIKKEPLNPYGPWYLALGQYRLGNLREALHWLNKTQELSPTWEQDYIRPYRTAIEKKLAGKSPRSTKNGNM